MDSVPHHNLQSPTRGAALSGAPPAPGALISELEQPKEQVAQQIVVLAKVLSSHATVGYDGFTGAKLLVRPIQQKINLGNRDGWCGGGVAPSELCAPRTVAVGGHACMFICRVV